MEIKKFNDHVSNTPILYIDMDDTLCDYLSHYQKMCELEPQEKYPQSKKGFFLELKPIEGAIESVNKLREKFDVYILTRPSYKNPLCYTEKRIWIEENFDLEFCQKLIISPNKDLLMGEYLIDDVLWPGFKGEQIQFGIAPYKTWENVLNYLF